MTKQNKKKRNFSLENQNLTKPEPVSDGEQWLQSAERQWIFTATVQLKYVSACLREHDFGCLVFQSGSFSEGNNGNRAAWKQKLF